MIKSEELDFLQHTHISVWLEMRERVEDELSLRQSMFCLCGKLATGFHERNCKRFHAKIIRETINRLKYLIPKAENTGEPH